MARARLHLKELAKEWLVTLEGKQFHTDMGEEDYHAGYQDA